MIKAALEIGATLACFLLAAILLVVPDLLVALGIVGVVIGLTKAAPTIHAFLVHIGLGL